MAFIQNDLRCNIFRSPTERPCLLATLDLLCKTKVNLTEKIDQSEPCSVPNADHPGINSKKKSSLPVLHIHLSPTWDSQASGPCKWFLFCEGTQTLQSHNPHRTWQCSRQSFPWKYQWSKKSVRVKEWKIFTLVGYIQANLSLSRLQTSPPRHASSNMYTNLLSLNVRYILRGGGGKNFNHIMKKC